MVNIDFHEQVEQQNEENKGAVSFLTGWQISVLLLLVVFTIYGVSYYYKKIVKNQVKKVELAIQKEKQTVNKDDIKTVVNFVKRKNVIEKVNSQENSEALAKLLMLEKNINQGIYLTSYNYSKNQSVIEIKGIGANYHTVAQQVYNFKNDSQNVRFVKIHTVNKNEDGGVDFGLTIGLKN